MVQSPRMGFFHRKEGLLQDGRPVYQNPQGQFVYYWGAFKAWRIGDSYTSPFAGVKSKAQEGARCPYQATGWRVFAGSGWIDSYNVQVLKASSQPAEAISLNEAVELKRNRPPYLRRRGGNPSAMLPSGSWCPVLAVLLALAGIALLRSGTRRSYNVLDVDTFD